MLFGNQEAFFMKKCNQFCELKKKVFYSFIHLVYVVGEAEKGKNKTN